MILARAGLVLFAQLGGVHGKAPALIAIAVTGASLLLLAASLDSLESLEDVSTLRSVPRRLVLVLGALSLGSFPPFPGFFVLFPLSSAVLERGYAPSLAAASVLLLLVLLGAMRLVSRALHSEGSRTNELGIGPAALGLSLAAILLLSMAPAPLVELARAAALVLR
jgi:formate hydrogenlyase subunit 3/multisubunit Na+/H+ antiporter MnhD subunit